MQMHHHRAEHWVILAGTGQVTVNGKQFLLSENQSTFIPIGAEHCPKTRPYSAGSAGDPVGGRTSARTTLFVLKTSMVVANFFGTKCRMTQLTCFKAYDIRGELGEELNEDIAYRIGAPTANF